MGALTASRPKCLLPVASAVLLDYTLDNLRRAGCTRIVVITGYLHEQVERRLVARADVRLVHNPQAAETNVLHSLMCAERELGGPVIVTYSDTLLSWRVVESLLRTAGDIVVSVDRDWRSAYSERTEHPTSEAEKVYVDERGLVVRFGKHLAEFAPGPCSVHEFTGMLRTTARGTDILLNVFRELDAVLDGSAPFQAASRWRDAYLTDLLQECVDRGELVVAASVERGWLELDTPQDYRRLPELIRRQNIDLPVLRNS
jgi:choline kinase